MSLCLLLVRYGDDTELLRKVDELSAAGAMIACADNGPGASSELLRRAGDGTLVAHAMYPDNPGYFPAAFAVAEGLDFDAFVICNYDLDFSYEALARWIKTLVEPHSVLCPQVRDLASGDTMNPHLVDRPPSRRYRLRSRLFQWTLGWILFSRLSRLRRRLTRRRSQSNRLGARSSIFAPHGSIVVFGRDAFHTLAGRDPSSAVLYSEEVWLGCAAEECGLAIAFDPAFEVVHDAHRATSSLSSATLAMLWHRATIRCEQLLRRREASDADRATSTSSC